MQKVVPLVKLDLCNTKALGEKQGHQAESVSRTNEN